MGSAISGKYNVDLEPPIGDAHRSDDAPMTSTALKTPAVASTATETVAGGKGDATQQERRNEENVPQHPEQPEQQQQLQQQRGDDNKLQTPQQPATVGEPRSSEIPRPTKGRFTINIGEFFKKRRGKKPPAVERPTRGMPAPGYGDPPPSVLLRQIDQSPNMDANGEGDNTDAESLTDLLGPPETHDEIPDFDAITGKLTFKKAWRGQSVSAGIVDAEHRCSMNPSDCKVHGHHHEAALSTQSHRTESDQTALKSSADKQRASLPRSQPQRPPSAACNTNGREEDEENNCSESHGSALNYGFLPSTEIADDPNAVGYDATMAEVITEQWIASPLDGSAAIVKRLVGADHLEYSEGEKTGSFDHSTNDATASAGDDDEVTKSPETAGALSYSVDPNHPAVEYNSEDAVAPEPPRMKLAEHLTDDVDETDADRRTCEVVAETREEKLTEEMTSDFPETKADRRTDVDISEIVDHAHQELSEKVTGDFSGTVFGQNRVTDSYNAEAKSHQNLCEKVTGNFGGTIFDGVHNSDISDHEKFTDKGTGDFGGSVYEGDRSAGVGDAEVSHDERVCEKVTGHFVVVVVEEDRLSGVYNAETSDLSEYKVEQTSNIGENIVDENCPMNVINSEITDHEEFSEKVTSDVSEISVDNDQMKIVHSAEMRHQEELCEQVIGDVGETTVTEHMTEAIDHEEFTETTSGEFHQTFADTGCVNHLENAKTNECAEEEKLEEIAEHVVGDFVDFPGTEIETYRSTDPVVYGEQKSDQDATGIFQSAVVLSLRVFAADGASLVLHMDTEEAAELEVDDIPDQAESADPFSIYRFDNNGMTDCNDDIADQTSGDASDNPVDVDRPSLTASVQHAEDVDHTPEEPVEQVLGDVQDNLVDTDRLSVASYSDHMEKTDNNDEYLVEVDSDGDEGNDHGENVVSHSENMETTDHIDGDLVDMDRHSIARSDSANISDLENDTFGPIEGDLPDNMIDDDPMTTADYTEERVDLEDKDTIINMERFLVVRSDVEETPINGEETAEQTKADYPDNPEDNGSCLYVIRSENTDSGNPVDTGRLVMVRSDVAESEDLSAYPIESGHEDIAQSGTPTADEDEITDPVLSTSELPDKPIDLANYVTPFGFVDLVRQHNAQDIDDDDDNNAKNNDAESRWKAPANGIGDSVRDESGEVVESSIKSSLSRIIQVGEWRHVVGDDGHVGNTNNSNDDDDDDLKKKRVEEATEASKIDGSGGADGGGEFNQLSSTSAATRSQQDNVSPEPPESCFEDDMPEYQLPSSTTDAVDNGNCSRADGDSRSHRYVVHSPRGLVNRTLVTVVKHGEQDNVDAEHVADGLTKADI